MVLSSQPNAAGKIRRGVFLQLLHCFGGVVYGAGNSDVGLLLVHCLTRPLFKPFDFNPTVNLLLTILCSQEKLF